MKNKIRIFTTSSCPWCHKTKEYLDANKIKYENIDVTRNRKAADEMIELSGQVGVPVIDINGNNATSAYFNFDFPFSLRFAISSMFLEMSTP